MSNLTRREFLRRAGSTAAAGALLPAIQGQAQAAGSLRPVSMAMHVHASFSEGPASMEAQLTQAARNGVDVLWWTEHDWRMSAYGYRRELHFDALSEDEDGNRWTLNPKRVGTLQQGTGGIVTRPVSPKDTSATPGSLRTAATATGTAFAKYGYVANSLASRQNIRSSLAGQSLAIEVYPENVGPNSFLEILVETSLRPAQNGRPEGSYLLSYRLGGPGAVGSRVASGLTGIVTLPATPRRWNSLTLRPADDLSAIWRDVDGRDASLNSLSLFAASRKGAASSGYFDYLRFIRAAAPGNTPLQVQSELMQLYKPQFPAVTQYAGLEVSLLDPHVNWYGGALALPDYSGRGLATAFAGDFARQQIQTIHGSGGLASYNHAFGTSPANTPLSESEQEAARVAVTTRLLSERVYGADIFEVGYRLREGVDLARHVAVWDACSRNGIWLTGNGVSDNHTAEPWLLDINNFLTWAWARGPAAEDLVGALAAGRVFFGDPRRFFGVLDLIVDRACPMGSVSMSSAPTRLVDIRATGVPDGGQVLLVQGAVDYAGPDTPAPQNAVTALPAEQFGTGRLEVPVGNAQSSYVRVAVLDEQSLPVAFSNPIWLLREQPPGAIPAARIC